MKGSQLFAGIIGILVAGMASGGDEYDAMAMAAKHGCIACHHLDTKVVGPSWNEITRKYAGQTDIVEVLAGRISKGTKGTWGDLPMPPNTTIPGEEIRAILRFVLTR